MLMPLNEIIYDFLRLRSNPAPGAMRSLDYELYGYRASKLVKLDILLNGDVVDALSFIVFADKRLRPCPEDLRKAEGEHSAPDV